MTLPGQFRKENTQNIFIYHYIEELISNFKKYVDENFDDSEISASEFPVLIRLRYIDNGTQKEIVDFLNISDGYTAKLLRKFEVKGYITRQEDPTNRRRKIVKLTQKGIEKTDYLIKFIDEWESKISTKITKKEAESLKEILFKLLI